VKIATQKKIFEIDRENPLHGKKSLILTVEIWDLWEILATPLDTDSKPPAFQSLNQLTW
jgi:hypothetical protein